MARQTHATDFAGTGEEDVTDYMHLRIFTDKTIDTVGEREFADSIEYTKFMADSMVIELHASTDKNAATSVRVGVNGEEVWLPRSQKIRIPRRFVERLARSQVRTYKTVRNPDQEADFANLTKTYTAMDYGFSVIKDPSPKGRSWLERVTRESA